MIGEKIKKDRLLQNMSLRDLAKKSGVSKTTLSDIENNKTNPTMATLEKIADALEINIEFWFRSESIPELKLRGWDKKNVSEVKEDLSVYETIAKDMSNIINVPIVGSVRAGQPILAIENIEGHIPTLKEFLCSDNSYFYLRVKGDSMNLEFQDGSLLLIEKTPCIENGEIGVVLIDGMEATVKKVIQNKNMMTLIPMSSNPKYVPHMYDIIKDEIQIIGRVKQAIKIY